MAVLDFQLQHQVRDQWCWAAVAASICVFYQDSETQTQCGLARTFLQPGEDCCDPGASENCNIPFPLDRVLNRFGHLADRRGVVAFDDLNQEIAENQQPVAVRIIFSDTTAHFLVVIGCAVEDGNQILKVADPSEAAGSMTSIEYSAFKADYRPGASWDQTYFTAKNA